MKRRMALLTLLLVSLSGLFFCSKKVVQVELPPPPPPPAVTEPPPPPPPPAAVTDGGEALVKEEESEASLDEGRLSNKMNVEMPGGEKDKVSSPQKKRRSRSPSAPTSRMETGASHFTGEAARRVKAATHDDNEEIISYREFCRDRARVDSPYPWDISERFIVKVTHSDGNTAWNRKIAFVNSKGKTCFSAATPASGEIVLLPKIDLDPAYENIAEPVEVREHLSRKFVYGQISGRKQ
jgi:hypothetical protein